MKTKNFANDLLSSMVVFLVAVPLCLGIAIASGRPPAAGLVSGVIGGLIVGSLAGCPLQVTGPAAGLITLSWEVSQRFGPEGLAVAVILGGLLQLAIGAAGLGQWFRAASPAVIQGMLTGIGAVIVLSQLQVMIDAAPRSSPLANLGAIPWAVSALLEPPPGESHRHAALLGLATIAAVLAWPKIARGRLALVPGTLVGVVAAAAAAAATGFAGRRVALPDSLLGDVEFLSWSAASGLASNPGVWVAAATIAFVASAETLLTAAAVDRMSPGHRTDYDREVLAQGAGNALAGLLGGLPVTGVIVRSAANVQAGAKTRLSTILHGGWILLFAAGLPWVLRLIPVASLAAVLVLTGAKLLDPSAFRRFWRLGGWDFAEFAVTAGGVVTVDLLTGIVAGLAVATARIVWVFSHIDAVEERSPRGEWTLTLKGAGHFLLLPKITRRLESAPEEGPARVDASGVIYADHAFLECLDSWRKARTAAGQTASVDWGGEPPLAARSTALRRA